MTTEKLEILFSERQYFRQVWVWLLLIGINGLIIYGIISQVVFGQKFGDNPMSNQGLIITAIGTILFTILFFILRLDTAIKNDGVYYRFYPFQLSYKHISWDKTSKLFVRQYNPLQEYGGWGFRIGIFGKGQAFNVSGNKGLQIVYNSGDRFLIGTQKPDEMQNVLKLIGRLTIDAS